MTKEKVLMSECQGVTRVDGTRQLPSSGKSGGNGDGAQSKNEWARLNGCFKGKTPRAADGDWQSNRGGGAAEITRYSKKV